jgi:hypothetical protein
MIDFLNLINASSIWLLGLNPALGYSIMGVLLAVLIGLAGFALSRLRISPLWALCLLVPFLSALMLWVLALRRWPVDKSDHESQNQPTA